MSKQELISAIAEKADITTSQAEAAFDATFSTIKSIMSTEGGTVAIPKFGRFGTKLRAARKGRNPATGAEIQIPEATVPFFKAATDLKTEVNDKAE